MSFESNESFSSAAAQGATYRIPVSLQTLGAVQTYRNAILAEEGSIPSRKEALRAAVDVAWDLLNEEERGERLYLGVSRDRKGDLCPHPVRLRDLYAEAVKKAGPLEPKYIVRLSDPSLIGGMKELGSALETRGILPRPHIAGVMNYTLLMAGHLVQEMERLDSPVSGYVGVQAFPLVSRGGKSLKKRVSYRTPSPAELLSMTPR